MEHRMQERMQTRKHKKNSLFTRILAITAAVILLGIIAACVAFALLVDTTSWKDFDPAKLTNVSQTLYVYDSKGQEVAGVYNEENRTYVSLSQVPEHVQNAFIAIEDARFYSHNGIDYRRLVGSVIANLKSGSFSQGFSTISQQLIKNTHLTAEKTINRKVQEMYLAVKLEQEYSKEQILEMYLNYVYFGNGAYGIEAAAQSYFDKSVDELTIAEGAMLAGVIKATSYYAPHIDLEKSIERRNLVISEMNKNGFITDEEKEQAINEEPVLVVSRPSSSEYVQFVDVALREASEILDMSFEEMTASGYKVYTTMDSQLQKIAEKHFENDELFPENAEDGTKAEGAAAIIDSKTGAVKALAAGRDYTARGMNRAVDARRQPGSTIKPILVYGPAIDVAGYNGATLLEDKAIDIGGYAPNNYAGDFKGWVSLRAAVKSSINIPAVVVFNDIGVSTGKSYASASGIPFAEGDNNLSLALGGFTYGVTPLELAGSYQPYANQGIYNETYTVTRIEDNFGLVVYEYEAKPVKVVEESTAFIMTDILVTTASEGTAHRADVSGIEVAGKTGTNSYKGKGVNDAWTVAYTSEDVIAVWNGFDMPSDTHYMSSSATGGRYPALMINAIFTDMYASYKPDNFTESPDVVSVKLDKVLYEKFQQIALASQYTPDESAFYEYFTIYNQPTTVSVYWDVPLTVTDLRVELNEENQPVITFTPPQDYMIYTIIRQIDTEELTTAEPIVTLEGSENELYYIDTTATAGAYKYFIIPYNPNVTYEGGYLAGEASLSVPIVVPQTEEDDGFTWPWERDDDDNGGWFGNGGNQPTSSPDTEPTPTLSPTMQPDDGQIGDAATNPPEDTQTSSSNDDSETNS